MDVNTLRDRILEISHDEDAPDTNLNNKALRWLNSAYHELVDELRPHLTRYLQTEESITTNAAGSAILSADVYRIVRVVDTTNNRTLKEAERKTILDLDPSESLNGAPMRFWVDGATINVHPKSAVNLKVVYLAEVADLVADAAETTIVLPAQFHHALVWGGLVWSAIYERGFSTQGELVLFQRKWDEAKQNIKMSLASKPSGTLRVEPYDVA